MDRQTDRQTDKPIHRNSGPEFKNQKHALKET